MHNDPVFVPLWREMNESIGTLEPVFVLIAGLLNLLPHILATMFYERDNSRSFRSCGRSRHQAR